MPTARSFNVPHLVACLLVAVTAVLLSFGALVTTYEAAMAVPDWPSTYGHNMLLFPVAEWLGGPWDLFLEHGHRLLGFVVGNITLVLAGLIWWKSSSPVLRWLAVAAVILVCVQGVLGGRRVIQDDLTLAKAHACTGPLFFGVAIAIAVLTKRVASRATSPPVAVSLCAAVPVAAYAQLIAGAQLRHLDPATPPSTFHALVGTHVLLALVVMGLVIAAAVATWRSENRSARRWALFLASIVTVQLGLGVGTWVAKYGVPTAIVPESWRLGEAVVARSVPGSLTVTSHAVLGMLVFGVGVALAIRATGAYEALFNRDAELVSYPRRGGALV